MARAALLLAIGAIAGGGAAYYTLHDGASQIPGADGEPDRVGTAPADISPPMRSASAERSAELEPAGDAGAAFRHIAVYARAAEASSSLELESLIELALARPASRSRDLELEALLARLAELDAPRAARFAQSRGLESRFLVPLYRVWAETDADAALDELSLLTPPFKQREIALEVLDVIGNDADGVERVAAALPDGDRLSFQLDALTARAERDPAAAMQDLLALDNLYAQGIAMPRLARAAARRDPSSALAQAELIDDDALRSTYLSTVLGTWVELDADAVLAYLDTLDPNELVESGATAVLSRLVASNPERMLGMLDRFPPDVRRSVEITVFRGLAATDARAAVDHLAAMPAGQERQIMEQLAAREYGRQDPEGALAWVKSLPSSGGPTEQTLSAVLSGIASVDFDRAVDLVISEIASPGSGPGAGMRPSALSMMMSLESSNPDNFPRLADRLLALDAADSQPQVTSARALMVQMWLSRDPEAALDWALLNADSLDETILRSAGQRVARNSPELAVQSLGRVPAGEREGWIAGVAAGLAPNDTDRAMSFLASHRGEPGYDQGYQAVVQQIARRDPRAAADLLESGPVSPELAAITTLVARSWAEQDPATAADWVTTWVSNQGDTRVTSNAVGNVAGAWAQSDPDAARNWVLSFPRGDMRDAAMTTYLAAAAATSGSLDARVLSAYGSEAARQNGASRAIVAIGRADPDEARRLIDLHITDPDIRRRTEEQLAQTGGSG